MAMFQPFKKATRPETPAYLQAEIQRAQLAQRAKQQEDALRSQNLTGAAEIYGEATAPGSPISDYLMTQPAAPVESRAVGSIAEGVAPEASGYASSVAPEFASAGASAEAAVPEAVSAAEMTAASEGAVALGAEQAAAAAAAEATAAGATAAEIAAVEAAAIEAAAAGAAGAGGAAGGGTAALAAMGPVGWAALAALALSYAAS